ncbi:MAG: DUF2769 domain-containing protein [Candidatus Diapherotrites archaeon]|nr:DUF2769 domain-containing protein [Candidatus Diapherotrites archaeon]
MVDFEAMEKQKKELIPLCACPQCPSWIECKEKGGFCFESIGKSKCIKEENGCICGGCPVTQKAGLHNRYYCTRGSEKQLSK